MNDRTTRPLGDEVGSLVYELVIIEMRLAEGVGRSILGTTLLTAGMEPRTLTIDELGALLPHIEERLQKLLDPAATRDVMARLRNMSSRGCAT